MTAAPKPSVNNSYSGNALITNGKGAWTTIEE